jgi:uncharacterized membrane protein YgcG
MRKAIAILCAVILPGVSTEAVAQQQTPAPYQDQAPYPAPAQNSGQPAPEQAPAQLLAPEQLQNLVAPVALYPDPLLAQVLAASTYPLEIVEAQQFVQQHPELRGAQLTAAARQQPWDPSVQAMVAFPDAMALLTRDIQWTTDLGNAFLAQQADVMAAIQTMRQRAQQNGRLQSTPQETVTTQPEPGGPPAIQIQPADPQVIYVPTYNPVYVWGPPVWGAYPPLWYPPVSSGFGFGAAILLGSLFAGFLTWGGWGWGLSWLAHGLFLNNLFFHHFGFAGFGGAYGGRTWWAHNPVHRMGVAYPNRMVASRFGSTHYAGAGRFDERALAAHSYNSARAYSAPRSSGAERYNNNARSFNNQHSFNQHSFAGNARSYSAPRGFESNRQSPRGFSNRSHFSAPRSSGRAPSQHFSAPRSSGGGHFSGHSSGGHSSGGRSHGGSKHR